MKVAVLLWAACMLLGADRPAASAPMHRPFQAGFDLGLRRMAKASTTSPPEHHRGAHPIRPGREGQRVDDRLQLLEPRVMVELRQAAKLQGLDSVKVWACNQGCYDNSLIEQGGADVEGTYSVLTTLPFFTEYKSNSSLRSLVQQVGGVDKTFSNAVSSCVAALLFQDAAGKAVAEWRHTNPPVAPRRLKNEHAFDAQGTTGPTDAGNRVPPTCIVMAQVKNGKWTRAYPEGLGRSTATSATARSSRWT